MKYKTIKEHHLFEKAFHKGTRFAGKYVIVFVLKDYAAKRLENANPTKAAYNRFGVSVGKKVGGAVQRSRVKRILRAGYFAVEKELKPGFLIIIAPRNEILKAKSTDIERDLRHGFSKVGMFQTTAL